MLIIIIIICYIYVVSGHSNLNNWMDGCNKLQANPTAPVVDKAVENGWMDEEDIAIE